MRLPYLLYKRAAGAKGGKVYYAAFWDDERQDYTTRRSTGQTSRAAADAIARQWLAAGLPSARGKLLIPYLKDFWKPDGIYASMAEARRGNALALAYLQNSEAALLNHFIPFLERTRRGNLPLSRLTPAIVEAFQNELRGSFQPRRVNAILQALSVPLRDAVRLGLIPANPCDRVGKLLERTRPREILTPDEARAFFAAPWEDFRLRTINLLAATTGLRLGECLGLQAGDLKEDWIDVRHNWQRDEGLKAPKWNHARQVPCPSKTLEALKILAESNPWEEPFVFFGLSPGHPLDASVVRRAYQAALEAIGIPRAVQKERRLDFHAWRHWYNSMLRGRVPDHALRALTGHRSEEMTEGYSHVTEEQRKAVAELSGVLLN